MIQSQSMRFLLGFFGSFVLFLEKQVNFPPRLDPEIDDLRLLPPKLKNKAEQWEQEKACQNHLSPRDKSLLKHYPFFIKHYPFYCLSKLMLAFLLLANKSVLLDTTFPQNRIKVS